MESILDYEKKENGNSRIVLKQEEMVGMIFDMFHDGAN